MNPWIALGLVLMWITSVAVVGRWQNEAGHIAERVTWQAKDINELKQDNKAVHDLEEKYRASEQDHADIQAGISANYQEQIKNANQKTAALIASYRAGTFRLRDPNTIARPPRGSIVPEIAARSGGCDGSGDGGLSANLAESLIRLTGRCNNVRDKLAACQAVVVEDRAQ